MRISGPETSSQQGRTRRRSAFRTKLPLPVDLVAKKGAQTCVLEPGGGGATHLLLRQLTTQCKGACGSLDTYHYDTRVLLLSQASSHPGSVAK